MRPDLEHRMARAPHPALTTSGSHEGNTFLTIGELYLTAQAWIITIVGGVVFAAAFAQRMDGRWLERPIASFKMVYVNPWSRAAMAVSPRAAKIIAAWRSPIAYAANA